MFSTKTRVYSSLKSNRFSILELVAAIALSGLLLSMGYSLITTTHRTHIHAQQQSQSIRVLDNVVQRLGAYDALTVADVDACLTDEFSKAAPMRKHELEAVTINEQDGVQLVIRQRIDGRILAAVEVPYGN